jgi:hypothetical protein
VFIAGYYLSMSLGWSWVCALLGSTTLMVFTAPLYWCGRDWMLEAGPRAMHTESA